MRAAEKVAALPHSAHAAMAAGQLDIDQAAQLHEYADDPKAVERILRSGHLGYALAAEGQKREEKARTAAMRAALTEAGFTLVGKPKDFPWSSRATALGDLADDGQQRAPEDPEPTDGHAVFVEGGYGGPRAVHICLDPDAHGHRRLRHTSYVSPEEIARREAHEQARAEHARQMAAAREVRHKFLRTLIGSQKAAAKHTELLLTVAARWPSLLTGATRHALAEQLCGEVERWTRVAMDSGAGERPAAASSVRSPSPCWAPTTPPPRTPGPVTTDPACGGGSSFPGWATTSPPWRRPTATPCRPPTTSARPNSPTRTTRMATVGSATRTRSTRTRPTRQGS